MDPLSIIAGFVLAMGVAVIDTRSMDFFKRKIDNAISKKAKKTTLVIKQPTEKFKIKF
jgi:hypothetical protein